MVQTPSRFLGLVASLQPSSRSDRPARSSGSWISSVTSWSPRPPPFFENPLPLRRRTLPEPEPGPILADVFRYQATDGEALSNEAYVTVARSFPWYVLEEDQASPEGELAPAPDASPGDVLLG